MIFIARRKRGGSSSSTKCCSEPQPRIRMTVTRQFRKWGLIWRCCKADAPLKRRNSWRRTGRFSARVAVVTAFVLLGALGVKRFGKTASESAAGSGTGTTNHAAWEALQRANHMETLTPQGLSNAIVECELAKALDPNFAKAWCKLAEFRFDLVTIGSAPGSIMIPRAEEEVAKALQLDSGLSTGYSLLAKCKLSLDYDFVSAQPLFRKAIRLAPNQAGPKGAYAVALTYYGRFEEAETLFKELIRDYPTQPVYREILGETWLRPPLLRSRGATRGCVAA